MRTFVWLGAVVGSVLLIATSSYFILEPLGSPNAIAPDQKFDFQFGRGSGWHGLDLLRLTSDGNAVYEYQAERENWERKTFVVDEPTLIALRKAINDLKIWEMDRHYRGSVMDGTQWCLLIRTDGKSKAIYFDNNFPEPIRNLADFVDRAILERFADPVAAEVVPVRHHRKHEKELWDSIR